jgi:hypothetical protein
LYNIGPRTHGIDFNLHRVNAGSAVKNARVFCNIPCFSNFQEFMSTTEMGNLLSGSVGNDDDVRHVADKFNDVFSVDELTEKRRRLADQEPTL